MAHELFISYASADQAVAEAARVRLEGTHHLFCWMAPHDIPAGDAWDATTLDALDQSKVLVLLVGPDEQTPAGSDREVQRAVRHGINVIPLQIAVAMSPETLDLHIDRLADAVRSLIGQPTGEHAAHAGHHVHDAFVGPGKWLRIAGVAVLSLLIVGVGLRFGLHVLDGWLDRNDAGLSTAAGRTGGPIPESGDRATPTESSPAVESPAVPAQADGASASAGGQVPALSTPVAPAAAAAPEGRPAPAGTAATPSGTDVERPVREPLPSSTIGRLGAELSSAGADEDAAGKALDAAGVSRASAGTVVIEFTSTFPDGTVEVEVDGVKRWTQRLRIDRTPGVFERLKLQKPTQQFASALMVAPGDHKVTVTVLNAEGEVHDFTSTTLHVDASRSVTLRVRLTRFRNRLQLDAPAV